MDEKGLIAIGGEMKKGKLKKHRDRNEIIREKYAIKLRAGFQPVAAKKQLAAEFFLSYDSIHSILYREDE